MDARVRTAAVLVGLGFAAISLGCGGASSEAKGPVSRAGGYPAPPPPAGADMAPPAQPHPGEAGQKAARPDEARLGLGTEWGEQRFSKITNVPFDRADPSKPFAIGAIHYNDAAGVDTMTQGIKKSAISAVSLSGGLVTVQLKDDRGGFFNGFQAGERSYMVGQIGKRYTIVLRNMTASRIETVVSVDGLDVINGRSANFASRGYLLDPRAEVEIDGFRTSTESVAAFRFGAVKDSYAEKKTGDARNVGVIGVALFHEKGKGVPSLLNVGEIQKRHDANPFPGQFATPP